MRYYVYFMNWNEDIIEKVIIDNAVNGDNAKKQACFAADMPLNTKAIVIENPTY